MRILSAVVIATALVSGVSPALADSLPPAFSGAYIGLNAGAAWGSSSYATDPGCVPAGVDGVFCDSVSLFNGDAVARSGTGDLTSSGFTGGIQAGYNWQFGNVVFGGEGDFGSFDLSKSSSVSGAFPPSPFLGTTYALTESMTTGWLATLRGRAGYTVTSELLLYATGGVAFTDLKFSSSYSDNAIDPLQSLPGGTGSGRVSNVITGWTIGGGGEWLFDANWSIKAEYLYLNFGSMGIAVPLSNTAAFAQTMQVEADLSAQIARVGINYRQ